MFDKSVVQNGFKLKFFIAFFILFGIIFLIASKGFLLIGKTNLAGVIHNSHSNDDSYFNY